MRIVHYVPGHFPVKGYGGTERVVYWLGKTQAAMGHKVTYLCKNKGGNVPFAEVISISETFDDLTPFIPAKTDIVHLHSTLNFKLNHPFLSTIHGNEAENLHPNTVFVSANHAARHSWTEYVHNGIDISEYPLKKRKEKFLLFLAKASWNVKNLPGAIRVANKVKLPLHVGGGKAPFWSTGVVSQGIIDGNKKLDLLQNAMALLFPVIWDEPFGIAVVEALACGTPVIATPRGALPEIVDSNCGILAESFEELVEAVAKAQNFDPEACRDKVVKNFTQIQMTEKYLFYYSKILKDGFLREGHPIASKDFPGKKTYYKQPIHHSFADFYFKIYQKFYTKYQKYFNQINLI